MKTDLCREFPLHTGQEQAQVASTLKKMCHTTLPPVPKEPGWPSVTPRAVPLLCRAAVPEAVPVIELPIDQVALHQVHVFATDPTAAAGDIPALCQDPFLQGEAVGEQARPWPWTQLPISQAGERLACTARTEK